MGPFDLSTKLQDLQKTAGQATSYGSADRTYPQAYAEQFVGQFVGQFSDKQSAKTQKTQRCWVSWA